MNGCQKCIFFFSFNVQMYVLLFNLQTIRVETLHKLKGLAQSELVLGFS
uniref:Uncharacterized protein n=1 Tax=Anguilla anguilla TaxID=7936 RepID=A0A0E9W1A3_ANGAN